MMDKPVFMIGMPRSGTTVLSEAISFHEKFGWLPNYLGRFPKISMGCLFNRVTSVPKIGWYLRGKKKQDKNSVSLFRRFLPYSAEVFPFWENVLGENFSWDYLIEKSATEDQKKNLTGSIRRVLLFQGKDRLFAKFTGPSRIHFLNSIFPESSFIHIIRDPRPVVSSLLKVNFWKQNGGFIRPWWQNGLIEKDKQDWVQYNRSPVALAAVQWRRVIEITWKERVSLCNNRFIEVKYEDFVNNPHEVLSSIFFKLKISDSIIAHKYISSIGRLYNMNYKYKEQLADHEIAMIEKITHRTAQVAGYNFGQ
jgi:hypothetical protein